MLLLDERLPRFHISTFTTIIHHTHHQSTDSMGRAKKVRKFAAAKRVIGKRDARLRENQIKQLSMVKKKPKTEDVVREVSVSNHQSFLLNLP